MYRKIINIDLYISIILFIFFNCLYYYFVIPIIDNSNYSFEIYLDL